MNAFENWFCGTPLWRWVTATRLLPWVLGGIQPGDHVLELGSGPGAGTAALRERAKRVTSLDYSHRFASGLLAGERSGNARVVQGDASALPFADGTFSAAVAILVLHHLRTAELQLLAFREVRRVLRPGGLFLAFEIRDSWMNRIGHIRSTFTPLEPQKLPAALGASGFSSVGMAERQGGFRFCATR